MTGRAQLSGTGARAAVRGCILALAAASVLALAACDRDRRLDDALAVELNDPERRHPIGFNARAETLDVEVPADAEGLSPNQHIDVFRFLKFYKREANSRLVIAVPGGPRPPASIAQSLQGIQRHVVEAGIDYRLTRARPVPANEIPAIRLVYRRPVAVPPTCDKWGENVARNEARIPYPNFGCATQHNLAIMVDNARDMQRPQEEDPRAGERRTVTWSAYVGQSGGGGGDSGGGDAAAKKPALGKK
ncbi:MAG: CpaD family pilus assembly protein [Hyphomonadaceae bacterium]|nr:CpaD family pilus assembly protein [Hyphomonadaceae bacterium]